MKKILRPAITVNRVFADKRSAMEAFVAVLMRELERCSVRTFDHVNRPQYTIHESEVKQNDTNT